MPLGGILFASSSPNRMTPHLGQAEASAGRLSTNLSSTVVFATAISAGVESARM